MCSLPKKLFHEKYVPHHHKMHIPEEEERDSLCLPHVYSKQTVPLILFWMILNGHNILSYVLVNANDCFSVFFI